MRRKFKNPKFILGLILALTFLGALIDLPRMHVRLSVGGKDINIPFGGYSINIFNGRFTRDLKIKKGLDIAGGLRVLLEADMGAISDSEREASLASAKDVVERRINSLGVSEPNIITLESKDSFRLSVELPGVTDSQKAIEEIEQIAFLEFRQLGEGVDVPESVNDFLPTDLTGKDLKRATVGFDNTSGEPIIELEFTSDGARLFEELTEKNVNKPLAIFLDNALLSAPIVQQKITGGRATITGNYELDEAKRLVRLLNAGSLPVPLKVVSQETVAPTLGRNSVSKSFTAGFIGLGFVMFFMVAMYGRLGILADVALLIYGILTLALYKLIPVVLTLPGIAGFILSIGMAVDANILIFERIREELQEGKPFSIALEDGFGRAWDSIRDANIATLLTSFILFNPLNWSFLHTSGPIRGFALTLALGIFISIFTGVVVTRNLVRVFYKKSDD